MARWCRLLLLVALLVMIGTTEAWLFKKSSGIPVWRDKSGGAAKEVNDEVAEVKGAKKETDAAKEKEPGTLSFFRANWTLTKIVGTKVWHLIEPHKFWLRFLGIKAKEEVVVSVFIIIANLAYCWVALLGFWFLPTNFMLMIVLVTLPFGPAAVLVFLGAIGGIVFFASQFPVVFVACIWVSWFVKSRVFQNLGRKYGLVAPRPAPSAYPDIDGDGQIDVCDFLRHAAQEDWTGAQVYQAIYDMLKSHRTPSEQQIDKILEILYQLREAQGLKSFKLPPPNLSPPSVSPPPQPGQPPSLMFPPPLSSDTAALASPTGAANPNPLKKDN